MTSPRDDGRFEVPVARLAGGRGQARRAAAVAATLVLGVGGAFAIARLSDRSPVASPAASGIAVRPTASPVPSRRASPGPRIEVLPTIPSGPLRGAPEVTLIDRVGTGGTDLRVLVWTPDDERTRTIRVVRGVLGADEPSSVAPILAPNRRHVLLLGTSTTGSPGLDEASVIDDEGRTLWTGDGVTAISGGLWSADSRLVVVPGRPRLWHLVDLDRPGHATDRTVTLPGTVYLPYPLPRTWLTLSAVEPRTVPLGFSADGAWIYGGVISPDLGMLIGQFRVAADGSRVEPVSDFGVGRADGLAPRPGVVRTESVDPVSGRVATSRINADTTGGPRALEVRGPDASFLFTVPGGITLGDAWAGDGSLVTLTADTLLFPDAIELQRIDQDGASGSPLLATGPLTSGALIGARDGFAVIALLATRPDTAMELVAVDLAHPDRVTALPLDPRTQLLSATLDR